MKALMMVAGSLVTGMAFSQAPDIRIRGDISLGFVSMSQSPLSFRTITPLGRFSTVSFAGTTPYGLKFSFSQRLANFDGDPDKEAFDEYYIEDPGSWRIGKQYVPFGGGTLFRESLLAVRGDTALLFEGVPVAFALVDSGENRQRGLVTRFGGRGFGVSAAVGQNFATNFSSLSPIRRYGEQIGDGTGWGQVFGVDWSRRFGKFSAKAETIWLRRPDLGQPELDIYDGQVSFDLGHKHSIFVGSTFERNQEVNWFRMGGVYNTARGVTVEATYRNRNGQFMDAAVFVRFKF
jgi:hypothetical protein